MRKAKNCISERMKMAGVNCYHTQGTWKSRENTCKAGWLAGSLGTKSRLKETARLAINCTSCTRWGVVGQRTFCSSYGNFLSCHLLNAEEEVNRKNGILDNDS